MADGGEQFGEARVQQVMADAAERLLLRPTVEPLGALIPVGDEVVDVADEDRLVGEVEDERLVMQLRLGPSCVRRYR